MAVIELAGSSFMVPRAMESIPSVYVIPEFNGDYHLAFWKQTGNGHFDSWTFDWLFQNLPALRYFRISSIIIRPILTDVDREWLCLPG